MQHLYLRATVKSPVTIRSDHAPDGAATTQYIPGTTLLGGLAAAHRLVRPEQDTEFADLFFAEQVFIPYLYPAVFSASSAGIEKTNLPVIPLPKTAQSCKRFSGFQPLPGEKTSEPRHGIRDSLFDWAIFLLLEQQQHSVSDLLSIMNEHIRCRCQQPMDRVSGYYRYARGNSKQRMKARVSTHLQTRTGINRQWGVVEESILYNREVFDENMLFWGEVLLPNEADNTFRKFVEEAEKEDVIRIGTGRTRGLGQVSIKVFDGQRETIAGFREKLEKFDATFKQQAQQAGVKELNHCYFAITLRSPVILRDAFLRYCTTLDGTTLARLLDLPKQTFKQIYQATETQRITGWCDPWGTPRMNDHAITMGSTFLFASSRPLDNELLQALYTLEETGLGQRRSEGFGRICISDPFHQQGEQL